MARYKGVNHLAMVTRDMDQTIRFWRDLLGMRLVAGLGDKTYKHYFFEISETDLIAFFEWPGGEAIAVKDHGAPLKTPIVFDHVSIGVESKEDLIELKTRLTNADFWVSELIDHGFIVSIYCFDPNNIPLEFSYCLPEVDIRRSPRMLDRYPSEVCQEGAEPQEGHWPDSGTDEEIDVSVYPGEGIIFRKLQG